MLPTLPTTASSAPGPDEEGRGLWVPPSFLAVWADEAWANRRHGRDCCAQTIEQFLTRIGESREDQPEP
jgi:hypothetical protein